MEVHKIANSNVSVLKPIQKSKMSASRKNYIRKIHKRRLTFIGIAFAIVISILGFQLISAHRAYSETTNNIEISRQKLDKQQAVQGNLKVEKSQLKNTSYLEKYIREKYMYSKPGEQIYNLPDDANTIQK
jgi:Septum formation initiator